MKRLARRVLAASLSVVLGFCFSAAGATFEWTGEAGDGKWETKGNWKDGAVPVSSSATVVKLSTRAGAPDIVKAGGQLQCRLVVAAGSAALKLSGGTFQLVPYGGIATATASADGAAFYCGATGVPVEIASTILLTGERHFLQAEGSDVTFSGRFEDSETSRKGVIVKFVEGGSDNARFTLAGTCTMWGYNGDGTVVSLRGGTNVITSAAAVATGSSAANGRSTVRLGTWGNNQSAGTTLVLAGGTYNTSFNLNKGQASAMGLTTVFTGDTVVTGDFFDTSGGGGTKTFVFDGATSVKFSGNVAMGTKAQPTGSFAFAGKGNVSFRVDGAFISSQTAKNVDSGFHCDFWVGAGSRFGGNHGSATDFYFQYDTIHALAPNVFDPRTVLRWGYFANDTWGVFDMNGFDQTVNRLAPVANNSSVGRLVTTPSPARLTLAATASAACTNRLSGPLTLVYDATDPSYVQALCVNAYAATGDLIVSNGTLRLQDTASYKNASAIRIAAGGTFEHASTAALALRNVPLVEIEAGGTFRWAAGAEEPFGRGTVRFNLATGSVIDLPPEAVLTLPEVWVDGVLQAGGRYQAADGTDATATRVAWLTGGGLVDVSGLTQWKAATDGVWSAAANWTEGTPDADRRTRITAAGDAYTVSVSGAAVSASDLEMGNAGAGTVTLAVSAPLTLENGRVVLNAGARVTVPEGGRVTHRQALFDVTDQPISERDCDRMVLSAGAEWTVSGGETVLTNFLGRLRLSGTPENPARMNVSGGRFDFLAAKTTWSRIVLEAGGELNVSGGRMRLVPGDVTTSYAPLQQNGGTVNVSGDAVLEFGNTTSHAFGTGVTTFDGTSMWTISPEVSTGVKLYMGPLVNATTSRVVMAGSSKFWTEKYATVSLFQLGYDQPDTRAPALTPIKAGTAIFDYSSDAYSRFGAKWAIGSDYCRGEAYLRAGTNSVHYAGVDVGGFTDGQSVSRTDAHGEGLLEIDGGKLSIEALNHSTRPDKTWLDGLVVGAGYRTVPNSASFYRGRLDLKRGELNNRSTSAFIMLGAGQAEGVFVQRGGTFTHAAANFPMVLGFEGGTGFYALSNGTATVASDLYVGGVATNTLNCYLATLCRHRHDATGRLVLAGGTLTVAKDVIVSADGFGTIEVGPAGCLTARNLVLSNGTEAVSTAALAFTVGPQGETGAVTATGALVVRAGATLTVDFSAYAGAKSSFGLVSCNGLTGAFAEENISVTGLTDVSPSLVRVVQDAFGVRVSFMRGTLLTFR